MTNHEAIEVLEEVKMLDDSMFAYSQAYNDALGMAIEALKAHEPHVMTLEEVTQHDNQNGCVWFEQPTYNAVAAFVMRDEDYTEIISPYILGEPINHCYMSNSLYGKTWRCWTSRPSDEVRRATPWTQTNGL